jgi:hypothetical protein
MTEYLPSEQVASMKSWRKEVSCPRPGGAPFAYTVDGIEDLSLRYLWQSVDTCHQVREQVSAKELQIFLLEKVTITRGGDPVRWVDKAGYFPATIDEAGHLVEVALSDVAVSAVSNPERCTGKSKAFTGLEYFQSLDILLGNLDTLSE